MKQYAVVTDGVTGKAFGIVVRDGISETCYGIGAKGAAWADAYNQMHVKSLEDELPYGVEVGDFRGMAHFEEVLIQEIADGNTEVRLLDRENVHMVKSEWGWGTSQTPSVVAQPLSVFSSGEQFVTAVEFKIRHFLNASAKSSLMAKVRSERLGIDTGKITFKSRKENAHLADDLEYMARSRGNLRRTVVDVYRAKQEARFNHHGYDPSPFEPEVKALGPRLGGGLRAAPRGMSFVDITGRVDGDNDGIVFEGIPGMERPIIPRFMVPKNMARRVSALVDGDSMEIEKARRSGNSSASIDEARLQELLGDSSRFVTRLNGQGIQSRRGQRRAAGDYPRMDPSRVQALREQRFVPEISPAGRSRQGRQVSRAAQAGTPPSRRAIERGGRPIPEPPRRSTGLRSERRVGEPTDADIDAEIARRREEFREIMRRRGFTDETKPDIAKLARERRYQEWLHSASRLMDDPDNNEFPQSDLYGGMDPSGLRSGMRLIKRDYDGERLQRELSYDQNERSEIIRLNNELEDLNGSYGRSMDFERRAREIEKVKARIAKLEQRISDNQAQRRQQAEIREQKRTAPLTDFEKQQRERLEKNLLNPDGSIKTPEQRRREWRRSLDAALERRQQEIQQDPIAGNFDFFFPEFDEWDKKYKSQLRTLRELQRRAGDRTATARRAAPTARGTGSDIDSRRPRPHPDGRIGMNWRGPAFTDGFDFAAAAREAFGMRSHRERFGSAIASVRQDRDMLLDEYNDIAAKTNKTSADFGLLDVYGRQLRDLTRTIHKLSRWSQERDMDMVAAELDSINLEPAVVEDLQSVVQAAIKRLQATPSRRPLRIYREAGPDRFSDEERDMLTIADRILSGRFDDPDLSEVMGDRAQAVADLREMSSELLTREIDLNDELSAEVAASLRAAADVLEIEVPDKTVAEMLRGVDSDTVNDSMREILDNAERIVSGRHHAVGMMRGRQTEWSYTPSRSLNSTDDENLSIVASRVNEFGSTEEVLRTPEGRFVARTSKISDRDPGGSTVRNPLGERDFDTVDEATEHLDGESRLKFSSSENAQSGMRSRRSFVDRDNYGLDLDDSVVMADMTMMEAGDMHDLASSIAERVDDTDEAFKDAVKAIADGLEDALYAVDIMAVEREDVERALEGLRDFARRENDSSADQLIDFLDAALEGHESNRVFRSDLLTQTESRLDMGLRSRYPSRNDFDTSSIYPPVKDSEAIADIDDDMKLHLYETTNDLIDGIAQSLGEDASRSDIQRATDKIRLVSDLLSDSWSSGQPVRIEREDITAAQNQIDEGFRGMRSGRPIGSDLPFNLDGTARQQFDESDEDFAFRTMNWAEKYRDASAWMADMAGAHDAGQVIDQVRRDRRRASGTPDAALSPLDWGVRSRRDRVKRVADFIRELQGDNFDEVIDDLTDKVTDRVAEQVGRGIDRLPVPDGIRRELKDRTRSSLRDLVSGGMRSSRPEQALGDFAKDWPTTLDAEVEGLFDRSPRFRPIGSDLPFNLADGTPRQMFDESDADFAKRSTPIPELSRLVDEALLGGRSIVDRDTLIQPFVSNQRRSGGATGLRSERGTRRADAFFGMDRDERRALLAMSNEERAAALDDIARRRRAEEFFKLNRDQRREFLALSPEERAQRLDEMVRETLETRAANAAARRTGDGMRSTRLARGDGQVRRDERGNIIPERDRDEVLAEAYERRNNRLRELGFSDDEINTLTNGLRSRRDFNNLSDTELDRVSGMLSQERADLLKELGFDYKSFNDPDYDERKWRRVLRWERTQNPADLFEDDEQVPENVDELVDRLKEVDGSLRAVRVRKQERERERREAEARKRTQDKIREDAARAGVDEEQALAVDEMVYSRRWGSELDLPGEDWSETDERLARRRGDMNFTEERRSGVFGEDDGVLNGARWDYQRRHAYTDDSWSDPGEDWQLDEELQIEMPNGDRYLYTTSDGDDWKYTQITSRDRGLRSTRSAIPRSLKEDKVQDRHGSLIAQATMAINDGDLGFTDPSSARRLLADLRDSVRGGRNDGLTPAQREDLAKYLDDGAHALLHRGLRAKQGKKKKGVFADDPTHSSFVPESDTDISMLEKFYMSIENRTEKQMRGDGKNAPSLGRAIPDVANSDTREVLEILAANHFAWPNKYTNTGWKIFIPDRLLHYLMIKNGVIAAAGGKPEVDQEWFDRARSAEITLRRGVPISFRPTHAHGSGKHVADPIKAWINAMFGDGAWDDLVKNAKNRGRGKVGDVPSLEAPRRGDDYTNSDWYRRAQEAQREITGEDGLGGGMRSRRRRGTPGIDRVSESDGNIWGSLTDEQRVVARQKLRDRETQLFLELTRRGRPLNGARQNLVDDGVLDPNLNEADLRKTGVVPDRELLVQMDRRLNEALRNGEITAEQHTAYKRDLDDLLTLNRMREADKYDFIEHLHDKSQAYLFRKRKNNADDAKLPAASRVPIGESTFYSASRGASVSRDTESVVRRATNRRGKRRVPFVERILQPDPNREARRAARRAKRQGGAGGGFTTDETNVGRIERARRAAGRLRRRVRARLTGGQTEKKVTEKIDDIQSRKAVRPDGDKIVLSKDATKALSRIQKILNDDPDALKGLSNKDAGDKVDISRNKLMGAIWNALDYNGQPIAVTADELAALMELGHKVILRGHGSTSNAQGYIDDPLRFLPGAGGEAAGPGEYWMDGVNPRGWAGWLQGNGAPNTVAVLTKNSKVALRSDIESDVRQLNDITQAIALAETGFPGGMDKSPTDDVAQALKAEFDKLSDLAKTSRPGQMLSQLIDRLSEGDADAVGAISVLSTIGNVRNEYNKPSLLAMVLGYDAMINDPGGTPDGRVLVFSRSSVTAADKSISTTEASEWMTNAKNAATGRPTTAPTSSSRASSGIKFGKSKTTPTWDKISKMKKITGPLGSQGGQWYEDNNGQKYFTKPGRTPRHAANEAAVAAIYNSAGVGAPTSVMDGDNGVATVVATGLDITTSPRMTPELQTKAKEHMGLDMLLSNWDAFGYGGQNIGLDKNGNLIRIDAGGGGQFRAQGGDKPSFAVGQPWGEPASMITSPFGQEMYGTVTNGDMAAAMAQIANLDLGMLDAAMKAAGVDDATRKVFRDVIQDRQRQAVVLQGQYAAADLAAAVVTSGSGPGSTVQPG